MSLTKAITYYSAQDCLPFSLYEYSVQPYATEFNCIPTAVTTDSPSGCEKKGEGWYQKITCSASSPTTANDFLSTANTLFSSSAYKNYVILKQFLGDNTCSEAPSLPNLLVAVTVGPCLTSSHLGSNVKAVSTPGQVTVVSCFQNSLEIPATYTNGLCLSSMSPDGAGGLYFKFDLPATLAPPLPSSSVSSTSASSSDILVSAASTSGTVIENNTASPPATSPTSFETLSLLSTGVATKSNAVQNSQSAVAQSPATTSELPITSANAEFTWPTSSPNAQVSGNGKRGQ
ncbi:UNVERIFIED_CONTAM: hypothetical protein HDU68_011498 [Siphonaria sp. JEL0065]|nr:hypothetical protein HDU68_011498 [Siphonaria sp. JEL0065]